MANIYINKDTIESIIDSYKNLDKTFIKINYIGDENKKICKFLIGGKECMIDIFIKKDGSINILPKGKNIKESNYVINHIAQKGFSVNTETKCVPFNCNIDIINNLKKYIDEEYNGIITYYDYKENVTKFKGYNGDTLTFSYFPTTQKAMIQGKPFVTFAIISAYLSKLPDFSIDDIININNNFVNVNSPSSIIRDEMEQKLGNSYKYLNEALLKSISGSLSLLNSKCFCEDYKGCLVGAFIGLEGFLKDILRLKYNYTLQKKETFKMFWKDKGKASDIDSNANIPQIEKNELNKLYALYSDKRNVYLHSANITIQTSIISKWSDAKSLSDEILETIKYSYDIIY